MLVSFLVPVYNVEKYLKECVESLLVQKGVPFEIVLLNDGSTDQSGRICDKYAEKYPDIVRVIHKNNEGLLMTRRRGFQEARGDWFICVDSDDYVNPALLEQVVGIIQCYDCDMVMYNYQYIDDCGNKTPSRLKLRDRTVYTSENKKELYLTRLFTTDINNMWLRAIHRDIVDIDTDYSNCGIRNMCEDAVQVLPLYTNTTKTVYIDENLYYYRKNQGSITGKVSKEIWDAIHKSFVITKEYLDEWSIAEEDRKKFYTKQMEVICNCTRWLFENETSTVRKIRKETILQLKENSVFDECETNFDKKYCTTKYMRFSVPILMSFLKREQMGYMKLFFCLERKIRRS